MGNKRRHESEEDRKERKRKKKEGRRDKPSDESTGPSDVFLEKRLEMTISLLPAALKDVRRSIDDTLRALLLKFSGSVGGILLAFYNVKVLKDGKGFILNDLPHVHYTVACDALVFNPHAGATLTGVVSKSFHSHLSLIVHNYFNASIPASFLREAGWTFDETLEEWIGPEALTIGRKVEFTVDKVYESNGIISLEGSKPILR